MKSMITKIAIAAGCLVAIPHFASASALITPTGFDPSTASSWLAGAVAGYNWQRGSLVFGLEGDISGTHLSSETAGGFASPLAIPLPSGDVSAKTDWYGTVRGRLGWATGSFLFYGTGGLAYGNVGLTNNFNLATLGTLNQQTSSVRVGWVAGVGVEYKLSRNLILGLEYQYVDLGSVSLGALSAPAPFDLTGPAASVHAQFQTAALRLTWLFPPPSSAFASARIYKAPPPVDPWAGFYAGGRAGGAWGNRLTVTPPTAALTPI